MPPIRFIVKLGVLLAGLALLSFLPPAVAVVVHTALLTILIGILIAAIVAMRELNLFRLPAVGSGSKRTVSGKKLRRVSYNGVDLFYTPNLNGGGLGLSYEFVRLVSKDIGKVGHIYEYCAGPGFIGFNLLAHSLCERLTLSDVNPEAVEAIRETIRENGLEDRVTVYLSDCLESIPEHERWDLIVSNPPWDIRTRGESNLVLDDPGARVHAALFRDAPKFLNPCGSILLVESHEYTSKKEMLKLLEGTKLKLARYFPPVRFISILKESRECKSISKAMAFTFALASSFLEIYLVQIERDS